MFLLLHIIVTYIKENLITKLQELHSPPRNPKASSPRNPWYEFSTYLHQLQPPSLV